MPPTLRLARPGCCCSTDSATGWLWNTIRLSKSGCWGGISLHRCTCASGLYSYWRASTCSAWSSCSQETTGRLQRIRARTGRVLMKIPSIRSMPGTDGGRPELTAPKTDVGFAGVAGEQQGPRSLGQGIEGQLPPADQLVDRRAAWPRAHGPHP